MEIEIVNNRKGEAVCNKCGHPEKCHGECCPRAGESCPCFPDL